jgi:hypothetical protein
MGSGAMWEMKYLREKADDYRKTHIQELESIIERIAKAENGADLLVMIGVAQRLIANHHKTIEKLMRNE